MVLSSPSSFHCMVFVTIRKTVIRTNDFEETGFPGIAEALARLCLRPKAPRRVIASVAKQSQPGKPRQIV
jgi:hypothetical protein